MSTDAAPSALLAYLDARKELEESDEKMKRTKARVAELERMVVEDWAASGTTQIRIDGRTIYTRRDLHVNTPAANRVALLVAVRAMDMVEMIADPGPTVQPAKLKAFVRECLHDGNDVPDVIAGLINVHQEQRLSVRG
jgi:hypothetical protein